MTFGGRNKLSHQSINKAEIRNMLHSLGFPDIEGKLKQQLRKYVTMMM